MVANTRARQIDILWPHIHTNNEPTVFPPSSYWFHHPYNDIICICICMYIHIGTIFPPPCVVYVTFACTLETRRLAAAATAAAAAAVRTARNRRQLGHSRPVCQSLVRQSVSQSKHIGGSRSAAIQWISKVCSRARVNSAWYEENVWAGNRNSTFSLGHQQYSSLYMMSWKNTTLGKNRRHHTVPGTNQK